MDNNDENKNEQLDFDAVPTLAEMKQKKYEQNGGDPMHELESHPNTSNSNGSKNTDYNDLTNLHKSKIRDDVQYNNYDDNANYQSETYGERGNKRVIIGIIILVLSICITSVVIRYNMAYKMAEREVTPLLTRPNRNAIEKSITNEQKAAEEEFIKSSETMINNYMNSMENDVDDFNNNFDYYDGRTGATEAEVNELLRKVNVNNTRYSVDKEIGVNINANDVTGTNYTGVAKSKEDLDFIKSKLIDSNRTYSIKCKYNEQGYIYEIEIVEN